MAQALQHDAPYVPHLDIHAVTIVAECVDMVPIANLGCRSALQRSLGLTGMHVVQLPSRQLSEFIIAISATIKTIPICYDTGDRAPDIESQLLCICRAAYYNHTSAVLSTEAQGATSFESFYYVREVCTIICHAAGGPYIVSRHARGI